MRTVEFLSTVLVSAGVAAQVTAADEAKSDGHRLEPFQASYNWIWHGLTVAESNIQLERSGETWIYRTKSEPRGIGRMFAERPTQESVMRVTDAGIQPLSYKADDGTPATKRDVDVKFDWAAGRITGVYEDQKVDMPTSPGIQDDLSVQIALMVNLLRGATPDRFSLLNGNSVRDYHYTREKQDTVTTPLGNIQAIVYRSEKVGSPRVTRFWCSPERGFIPVRVEQTRKDEVEWTMQLLTLKRAD